jgi:hypothetical protein
MERLAVYNASHIAYASGDHVELQANQYGYLIVELDGPVSISGIATAAPGIPSNATYETNTTGATDITDTSTFAMFPARGGGTHHYITSLVVTNASASVDTVVYVKDGSTIIFAAMAKAGSGFVWDPAPYFYQAGANAAINIVCRTTGAAIQATAIGYWA